MADGRLAGASRISDDESDTTTAEAKIAKAEALTVAAVKRILGDSMPEQEIRERLTTGTLALHGTELREYDDQGQRIDTHPADDPHAIWTMFSQRVKDDPPPRPARKPSTSTPRARTRSRESHSNRPGQRRTRKTSSSGRSSDDPDSPGDPPPLLPYRIAGSASDTRAVEAAFLQILTRRHPGTRWAVVS